MRPPLVLLLVFAGIAAGFFGGSLLRPSQLDSSSAVAEDLVLPTDTAAVEVSPELVAPGDRPRETPRSERQELAPETATASLFSEALMVRHKAEFTIGWKSERADLPGEGVVATGAEDFRSEVLALSRALGVRAAVAQTKSEASAQALLDGSGKDILRAIDDGVWAPPLGFVQDEAFAKITTSRGGAGAVDGQAFVENVKARIDDGAVLTFGPGVYQLGESRLRGRGPKNGIPKDVTIIGAGRDGTLLQIGDIGSREDIERITFKNISLDAQNNGLFDQRKGSLSIHLEAVRIVRFDAGHGGCTIFDSRGGTAVTAVNTEFMGGYGRQPGAGEFLDGEPFLGSFKNCVIELAQLGGLNSLHQGQVHFDGCRFRLKGPDPRNWTNSRVTFAGCSYEPIPSDASDLQKDLKNLFPDVR